MPDATRNRFLGFSLAAWVVACLTTHDVFACPDCASAKIVRASVFDDSFGTNLYLVSLPLLILAGISMLLYRIDIEGSP